MPANCVTGNLQINDASGCPTSFNPGTPLPAFLTFNAAGQVCTDPLTAASIPALNNCGLNVPTPTVQSMIDAICANLGRTSTFRNGPLVAGLVGSHIHNSGIPGAPDYTINIQANVLPFNPANCNRITSVNVQGAIDELCAYINTLQSHPPASLDPTSNTALAVNPVTQVIGLNLNNAGSYDNTNCQNAGTTPVPNNVQGAITALCAAINAIPSHPAATVNAASNPALTINAATQVLNLNLSAPGSFDPTVCNAAPNVTGVPDNVQGAIDRLCALITTGGATYTVNPASNPALTLTGTVFNLDLDAANSFDPTACNAVPGIAGVPNSVQDAITFLCQRSCLVLTNNYDAANCYGSYDCATNTLNISPMPTAGRGVFGTNQAVPPNAFTNVPVMPNLFGVLPASFAPAGTNTLIVPRSGQYMVAAGAVLENVSLDDVVTIRILRNGVEIARDNNPDITGANRFSFTTSTVSQFTAGDVITVQTRSRDGTTLTQATVSAAQQGCA